MTFEFWTVYVATVLLLMSTPGPSQLLILSNAGKYGYRRSIATIFGDLTANALQMIAAGFGLAALIAASENVLFFIKWFGVIYLIWLGVRMIRNAKAETVEEGVVKSETSLKALWLQGFLTSAANPKAVVFFAALFPQFIDANLAFAPQFLILSATYIVIDATFLSAYGLGSSWIASKFQGSAKIWIERLGGTFMIVAAVLLGAKTIDTR